MTWRSRDFLCFQHSLACENVCISMEDYEGQNYLVTTKQMMAEITVQELKVHRDRYVNMWEATNRLLKDIPINGCYGHIFSETKVLEPVAWCCSKGLVKGYFTDFQPALCHNYVGSMCQWTAVNFSPSYQSPDLICKRKLSSSGYSLGMLLELQLDFLIFLCRPTPRKQRVQKWIERETPLSLKLRTNDKTRPCLSNTNQDSSTVLPISHLKCLWNIV